MNMVSRAVEELLGAGGVPKAIDHKSIVLELYDGARVGFVGAQCGEGLPLETEAKARARQLAEQVRKRVGL